MFIILIWAHCANYFQIYELFSSLIFGPVQMTDYGQTESDAYEPTMQVAQVGSKIEWIHETHELF